MDLLDNYVPDSPDYNGAALREEEEEDDLRLAIDETADERDEQMDEKNEDPEANQEARNELLRETKVSFIL